MDPEKLQQLISKAIDDAKGVDIKVLDVRNISDVADYLVIASGTSSRHVSSVADRVVETLRDEHNIKPIGTEGRRNGEWVLLDFGDVIAHVMHPDTRLFYQLEKLWGEAGEISSRND